MKSSKSSDETFEEEGVLGRLLSNATSEIAKESQPSCVVFLRKKGSQGSEEEVPISMDVIREDGGNIKKTKKTLYVERLPPSSITQVREIMVEAVNRGLISKGKKVFCLTDESLGKGFEGLFLIFKIDEDFMELTTRDLKEDLDEAVLDSVMKVARELASEGREGRAVGTGFVIGDHEEVINRTKQLVLNPFKGTSMSKRNISDPQLKETVKEFAQIDGVFILDKKGFVRSAGAYLNIDTSNVDFPGLGARHHACAAITEKTGASSICVSESGAIRVFRDGNLVLEEKVRSGG